MFKKKDERPVERIGYEKVEEMAKQKFTIEMTGEGLSVWQNLMMKVIDNDPNFMAKMIEDTNFRAVANYLQAFGKAQNELMEAMGINPNNYDTFNPINGKKDDKKKGKK